MHVILSEAKDLLFPHSAGSSRLVVMLRRSLQVSGGQTARVTPVPIPNTEVKPRRADDTARVTVWERRSPPGLNLKGLGLPDRGLFVFAGTGVQTLCTSGQLVFCVSPLVESEAQPGPPKAGEKSAQPC